jgi:hypothetical protein
VGWAAQGVSKGQGGVGLGRKRHHARQGATTGPVLACKNMHTHMRTHVHSLPPPSHALQRPVDLLATFVSAARQMRLRQHAPKSSAAATATSEIEAQTSKEANKQANMPVRAPLLESKPPSRMSAVITASGARRATHSGGFGLCPQKPCPDAWLAGQRRRSHGACETEPTPP